MKSKWIALVFTVVCLNLVAHAQVDPNIEQGMKPYGSYEGGSMDSVSLTNGNLTIHQPLWSAPQRGDLAMSVEMAYNNKQFTVLKAPSNCGSQPQPPCTYTVVSHVQGITLVNDVGFYSFCQPLPSTGKSQAGLTLSFTSCTVTTPDGAKHLLADTGQGYYLAIDGSGFRYNPSTVTGIDASGTNATGAPLVVTDRNGNRMTGDIVDATSAITDTLGRSIPQSVTVGNTASCPSLGYAFQAVTTASVFSFPSPTGSSNILVCYANVTIHSNFFNDAGSQVLIDANVTTSMIQSIVLPDGTYYAFEYDGADPNNPASVGYGDLLKMTLPTGGSISYTWTTSSPCSISPSYIPSRAVTIAHGGRERRDRATKMDLLHARRGRCTCL